MPNNKIDSAKRWYAEMQPTYIALTDLVQSTLEGLLKNENIDYLSVTGRAKTMDSFSNKLGRKDYSDPTTEITDLAGVRIITFIERDVDLACALVAYTFNIHENDSLDKSGELNVDQFGYRSVHFICDLGNDRMKLPEFKRYDGCAFEIQIRTVLQHAWAEVEHDRSYKFSGVLPAALQRRFYLIAGLLEMADREFSSIAEDLDQYSLEVSQKTKQGELDVEVNSTSIKEYLPNKLNLIEDITIQHLTDLTEVIGELSDFGVTTLAELEQLLTGDYLNYLSDRKVSTTSIGFLRSAMIYQNIEIYFDRAYHSQWELITEDLYTLMLNRYGNKMTDSIIEKYELELDHADP